MKLVGFTKKMYLCLNFFSLPFLSVIKFGKASIIFNSKIQFMENSKPSNSKLYGRSTISESKWCQSSIVQFNLIWTLTSFYALQTALVPLFKTICPIPNLEHELISPEPFLLTFWIHWPSIKIGRCVPPNFPPPLRLLSSVTNFAQQF